MVYKSKVLSSNKIDKYGILTFYKDYVDLVDRSNFAEYCLSEAKNADIIHIHSAEQLVIKIRKAYGNSKKDYSSLSRYRYTRLEK